MAKCPECGALEGHLSWCSKGKGSLGSEELTRVREHIAKVMDDAVESVRRIHDLAAQTTKSDSLPKIPQRPPQVMKHPIQPLAPDEHGTIRFKENKIVDFLAKQFGLNELAALGFPREDWEQLAQLIGYSLSGFGDLSYVRDSTWETADAMRRTGKTEDQARIEYLEAQLSEARNAIRQAACAVFRVHPDDLHE